MGDLEGAEAGAHDGAVGGNAQSIRDGGVGVRRLEHVCFEFFAAGAGLAEILATLYSAGSLHAKSFGVVIAAGVVVDARDTAEFVA